MSEIGMQSNGIAAYLSEHLGRDVIAEFQCGADDPVRKAGTLTMVTQDYLVLRDDMSLRDTVCSLNHLCFVTFYLSGTLPRNDGTPENSSTSSNGAVAASNIQTQPRSTLAALSHTMRQGRRSD